MVGVFFKIRRRPLDHEAIAIYYRLDRHAYGLLWVFRQNNKLEEDSTLENDL